MFEVDIAGLRVFCLVDAWPDRTQSSVRDELPGCVSGRGRNGYWALRSEASRSIVFVFRSSPVSIWSGTRPTVLRPVTGISDVSTCPLLSICSECGFEPAGRDRGRVTLFAPPFA